MNKFYITTSIPYVNGDPHIGHALEYICADVLARHARAESKQTIFATGSDEHGGKLAEKAEQTGVEPKVYVDKMTDKFKDLLKDLNISNDRFIRTTDASHEKTAQAIWTSLKDDIYKSSYSAWYCTGGENFVTDSVYKENKGICPDHNRPYERIEEENYFFKLSKYQEKIKQAVESGQLKIIPDTRKNEILSVINEGLEDISISRPKSKISWGIPVPGDEDQTIYVWFEALLNYLSVLNYPDGADFKKFWPADYQVIGKDILRFHAAIWPGILFGLKLPLPKVLYVHGFVNVDGKKMGKSLGNSVDPGDIIKKYGSDALRYYLTRHVPSYDDGDFSWEKMEISYNSELGNELGNALQRTVTLVESSLGGKFNQAKELVTDKRVDECIAKCQFDRALDIIWAKIKELNQYIDTNKPWELKKTNQTEKLEEVLSSQIEQLLLISKLLTPFLPETAEKISSVFSNSELKPLKSTLFPRIEVTKAK